VDNTAVTMRVNAEGGPLVAERVTTPAPDRGWVRVSVYASGVCYADIDTTQARGTSLPVTPGHEIAGVMAAVGADLEGWDVGDRVAVGWFGGSCGQCQFCRRGDVVHCAERKIPGVSCRPHSQS